MGSWANYFTKPKAQASTANHFIFYKIGNIVPHVNGSSASYIFANGAGSYVTAAQMTNAANVWGGMISLVQVTGGSSIYQFRIEYDSSTTNTGILAQVIANAYNPTNGHYNNSYANLSYSTRNRIRLHVAFSSLSNANKITIMAYDWGMYGDLADLYNQYSYTDAVMCYGSSVSRHDKNGMYIALNTPWYQRTDGKWAYWASPGTYQTAWKQVGGQWYYFSSGGVMQTGWIELSGKWYYLRTATNVPVSGPQGAMVIGWFKDPANGNWYYMNSSGVMQTGWVQEGGYWYFLHSNGTMGTGWIYTGGYWYYARKKIILRTARLGLY